ncbi:MAG TPA: hypothetical protein VIV11_28110 [Kofleriaceae bacterium]
MRRLTVRLTWLAVALLCSGLVSIAWAQEPIPGQPAPAWRDWRSSIELYGYLPWSINGDATVLDHSVDFEADAGDVIDSLEGAAAARLEIWRERLGLIIDTSYVQLGHDGEIGMTEVSYDVDISQLTTDFQLGWAMLTDSNAQLEVHAGVRGEFTNASVEIGAAERSNDNDLAKFVGALQLPVRITKHWRARARGTFAAPSGLSLQFLGVIEYDFNPIMLALGYRYDSLETDTERMSLSTQSHNVYVSLALGFGERH